MKKLVPLSKAEIKKVVGGAECGTQAGGASCPAGMCCSEYGSAARTQLGAVNHVKLGLVGIGFRPAILNRNNL